MSKFTQKSDSKVFGLGSTMEHRPQQEGGGGLGGGKRRGGGGQRLSQIKGAENKRPLYDS